VSATAEPRWVRWTRPALVAAGALVIGYAVVGALADPGTRPLPQLLFLAGVLVAHDAVLLPAALGFGVLIGRYLPAGRARAAFQLAGFVTVTLAVVAVPLVLGFGRRADEPSALPLAYGRGLGVILVLVWTVAFTIGLHPMLVRRYRRWRGTVGRSGRIGRRSVMETANVRYIVDDVPAAVEFYTGRLGFTVEAQPGPGFAILARGALRIMLSSPDGPGGASQPAADGSRPAPGGWNRIQLQVDDLDREVAALRAAGGRFRNEIVVGRGGRQVLLEDPSGNPVELFEPRRD